MSRSGRKAHAEVCEGIGRHSGRSWRHWEVLPKVREALTEVQYGSAGPHRGSVRSGGPLGGLEGVGRPTQKFRRDLEALPEVWVGSGGPHKDPGGSGGPPKVPGGVWKPPWRSSRGQQAFPGSGRVREIFVEVR